MIVSSPMGIYIIIEPWNAIVIAPTMVIIVRAIPAAPVWSPPPSIPEEQVYLYVGDNVNTISIRQYDYFRRSTDYNGR
jgi:hypothetical protein